MNYPEDNGQEYGNKPYVDIVAHSKKDEELELLVNKIHTELSQVRIGDWGGGNGILANRLLELCPSSISEIAIIDVDDTKFISRQKIDNIDADVRTYTPKDKLDYSMTRNVLHYLHSRDQEIFIRNMLYNTDKYSLIMNVVYPGDYIMERFESSLMDIKNVYRNFPSYESLECMIQKSHKIIDSKLLTTPEFDYFNFYKSRFNLRDDEAELLFKTGMPKVGEYRTVIFLCK